VLHGRWLGVGLLVVAALADGLACSSAKHGAAPPAGTFVEPSAAGAAGAPNNDGEAGASSDAGPAPGMPDAPFESGPPCNGAPALCDKSYSSLTFLGTHLSMASDNTWTTPTQGRTLTNQLLVGGVRVLELEIHVDNGDLAVCAGKCSAGSESLPSVLREIAKFAKGNPTDVLTLLLRSAAPPDDVAKAFDDQGLVALAHGQAAQKPWPTLRQMIDAQQTLVVFVDQLPADAAPSDAGADARAPDTSNAAPPAWMHLLSDWAWETAPSERTDCVIARGSAKSPLAILNHYVPGEAATDDTLIAAHTPEVIAARLSRCNDDRKQVPNFVLVDFAEVGDPNSGVQIADGLRPPDGAQ
jgi:hypothetical protein